MTMMTQPLEEDLVDQLEAGKINFHAITLLVESIDGGITNNITCHMPVHYYLAATSRYLYSHQKFALEEFRGNIHVSSPLF